MAYQLWETAAGNIVGAFPTEAAALAVVRESTLKYGREYASTWLLGYEDEAGDSILVAEGDDLVQRAKDAPRSKASA